MPEPVSAMRHEHPSEERIQDQAPSPHAVSPPTDDGPDRSIFIPPDLYEADGLRVHFFLTLSCLGFNNLLNNLIKRM